MLGWGGEGSGDANPGINGSGEAVSLCSLKMDLKCLWLKNFHLLFSWLLGSIPSRKYTSNFQISF